MQHKINIPLVDLGAQYQGIQPEIDRAMSEVLTRGDFVLGSAVRSFEQNFAAYCGVKHAVGVGSGLDALTLSLRALGIGAGDEVITAANTFVATTLAIGQTGAKPVLVDCDPETYTLDVDRVAERVTKRTKAVIPVHLYGQPAEMDTLLKLADEKGLAVIEDAAQAHGAEDQGRRCGSLGQIGCFSFYPAKNLGAYGDGGCVVTQDDELAEKIRMLRNYGSKKKYRHEVQGVNSRLDAIQAAVLNVKLKYLDRWNEARQTAAKEYNRLLSSVEELILPREREGVRHVYHLYVVQVENRDAVVEKLQAAGIGAGVHYPVPIHFMPCHQDLGYGAGDFPETEKAARHLISLPLFPEITQEQIQSVVDTLKAQLSNPAKTA